MGKQHQGRENSIIGSYRPTPKTYAEGNRTVGRAWTGTVRCHRQGQFAGREHFFIYQSRASFTYEALHRTIVHEDFGILSNNEDRLYNGKSIRMPAWW